MNLCKKNSDGSDVIQALKNADIADAEITTAKISGLDSALAGKAASVHNHTISNVSGLQTALDGKSATTHTHSNYATKVNPITASFIPKIDAAAAGITNSIIQQSGNSGIIISGGLNTTGNITQNGAALSLASHNHSLANLTEKSYNSLTDKPTINNTVLTATITLNANDIRSLTSHYTLIAAVANKVINVVNVSYHYTWATDDFYGGASAINGYINGLGQFGALSVAGYGDWFGTLPRLNNYATRNNLIGQSLTLLADAAITGNIAAGTLKIVINYTLDSF